MELSVQLLQYIYPHFYFVSKLRLWCLSNLEEKQVQYNLDYPNTLVIRMRKSVRITEINIKSMRDDFHLILQKVLFSFVALKSFPRKLGHFYDNFHP